MKQAGIKNAAELSRLTKISASSIAKIINMQVPLYTQSTGWLSHATRLSDFFGVLLEELFEDNEQMWGPEGRPYWYTVALVELSQPAIEEDPAVKFEKTHIPNDFFEALKLIGKRESKILKMRYGLLGTKTRPMTLHEIGKKMRLSRERVRTIEERAFMRLRRVLQKWGLIQLSRISLRYQNMSSL